MSGHVPEGLTPDQAEAFRNKKYIRIFFALCLFTFLEVLPAFFADKFPKMALDLWIVLFTILKAGFVGWYFMHLEYESKWTRIVAALPLMMLLYAAVLMPDTVRSRPISLYVPTPDRVLPLDTHAPSAKGHAGTDTAHAEATDAGTAPSVDVPTQPLSPDQLPDTATAERQAADKVVAALKAQSEQAKAAITGDAAPPAPSAGGGTGAPSAPAATSGSSEVDAWR